ncbi:MAG: methyltransferase [Spirochaetaceae bacterium]|nr:methyltransferase [Spirochaetaceae bacterium]
MVAGGDCIGKNDGKIIFVPDALPGEKLDIYITGQKRDYQYGRIAGIVEPAPERVEPPCPFYGRCGGCNLQIAGYGFQIELKRMIVEDAFSRAGFRKFQELPPVTVIAGEPWEYRSRFQFHRFLSPGGKGVTGLKARGAEAGTVSSGEPLRENIVPVTDCPVAVRQIREFLRSDTFPGAKAGRFTVFAGDTVRGEDGRDIVLESNTSPICEVKLLGRKIRFDVRGFFQSNLPLMEQMITAVCDGLEGERVADLYSGAGVFALFLQERFAKTVLVEQNRDALGWAEINLAGRKHTSYGMSCRQWVLRPEAAEKFSAVVMDPPRSGLEAEVCRWLCGLGGTELRYVSCNPVTLARDAVKLAAGGFTLRELKLLDFYPQTSHIECLAIFGRDR